MKRIHVALCSGLWHLLRSRFKIHDTPYLLSYRMADADTRELIMIGPHENYYRDLTPHLKTRH